MKRWNEKYHAKYKKHSLIDQVYDVRNLENAFKAVRANHGAPGMDGETIEQFEEHKDIRLAELCRTLKEDKYRPSPVLRVSIPKADGRERLLGIPTVRDRVVQQALKNILEPIFEKIFLAGSYGYRPGKSAQQAIVRITGLINAGYWWVMETDIHSFFDKVDHETLLDLANEQVSDGRVLKLIRRFLESGVLVGEEIQETPIGTPQGGVISPLLANIMLNHLDRRMGEEGYIMTRYADDFLVHCKTRWEAEKALVKTRDILGKELHLDLKLGKTKIVEVPSGVEFLGFRIGRTRQVTVRPTDRSIEDYKQAVREKTHRGRTLSIQAVIRNLNPTIRGWGNYYSISNMATWHKRIDAWTVTRLRSVVLKRKAHGWDMMKLPGCRFEAMGLCTLASIVKGHRGIPPLKRVGGSKGCRASLLVGMTNARPRAVYGKSVSTVQ